MVFALRDLFQAAFELKKKENDMKGESTESSSGSTAASPTTAAVASAASTPAPAAAAAAQPSLVLLCIHKHEICVYRSS